MARPRIVLIDDHPVIRQSLALVLGDAYDLVVYARAANAVERIGQWQPALALINLHLEYPKAGLDVVRALRADAATQAIPVVVWSADADVERLVAALALPAVQRCPNILTPRRCRQ